MASEERLRELEEKYEGYTVYDNQGSKIGKVDDLFVDETDNEEYIGVKMGLLGTKSTLIPTEIVRVNEQDRTIEVSESKDHVKEAPSFSDDDDITADYEERIRSHFGLGSLASSGSDSYGSSSSAAGATAGAATTGEDSSSHDRDAGGAEYASDSGTDRDRESPGEGTEHGEQTGSTAEAGRSDPGEYGDQARPSDQETYGSPTAAGETTSGTSGQQDTGSTSTEGQEGSTSGQPSTTRQTEETETFQEGGRTKIRRRIIREEVVDADEE